ncbi:MAG: hypothetical protein QOG72_2419 [Sphingomonadales bacterium]|jgi:hypothetical protein|nr:hypothetical protein [Sphingomonadales bacterium]
MTRAGKLALLDRAWADLKAARGEQIPVAAAYTLGLSHGLFPEIDRGEAPPKEPT